MKTYPSWKQEWKPALKNGNEIVGDLMKTDRIDGWCYVGDMKCSAGDIITGYFKSDGYGSYGTGWNLVPTKVVVKGWRDRFEAKLKNGDEVVGELYALDNTIYTIFGEIRTDTGAMRTRTWTEKGEHLQGYVGSADLVPKKGLEQKLKELKGCKVGMFGLDEFKLINQWEFCSFDVGLVDELHRKVVGS